MQMDTERRVRIDRLKWHCRRALLELDLLFQRFWQRHGDSLDLRDEVVLARLLEMEDHDLWAVLNGTCSVDDHELVAMVERIRVA